MEKEKLHTVSSAAPFIPSNWLSAVPSAAGAVSGTLNFSLAIPESQKPQPHWNTLQHPKLTKPKSPLNYNLERQSGKGGGKKKGENHTLNRRRTWFPIPFSQSPNKRPMPSAATTREHGNFARPARYTMCYTEHTQRATRRMSYFESVKLSGERNAKQEMAGVYYENLPWGQSFCEWKTVQRLDVMRTSKWETSC